MEETTPTQPTDLRDLLRPVRSRLWLIILCVALATGLTYYHYDSQPKQYKTSTSLYIGATDPSQLTNNSSSDRATSDLASLVQSSNVARIAAGNLHYKGNPQALIGAITAAPQSGTDFVTVTATAQSAIDAASLANAVADAFVVDRTNAVHAQADQAINQINRQLAALPNTTANATQRGQLNEEIQQLSGLRNLPTAGIKHVNPAFAPGSPFAPNPKKNAIFAFMITLMLSIAGAYGLERLDRRIRKLSQVEHVYGHPVLAAVPRTLKPAPFTHGAALLPNDLREAFRKLRMNLELASIGPPPKTIVVTSAVPREGKSTVTRNLALAYREAGLKVCVIDADLRRPGLSTLLGVDNEPGLTDVIVGDETLRHALTEAAAGVPGLRALARIQGGSEALDPEDGLSGSAGESDLEVGSLTVLPSGPSPANPPVLLGSDQMRSLLSTLADNFDVVVIDSSPLLAVSDGVPLLSAADGVIVVSRLAMTTSDAAQSLVEQIRRVSGANLLGVVANDVHGRDAGVKAYGYGYSYGNARAIA